MIDFNELADGLGAYMKKSGEFQEKISEIQRQLASATVKGEAGAGLVVAEVSADKKVKSIVIADNAPEDKAVLCELIVSAVNDGMAKADEFARDQMSEALSGMMPTSLPSPRSDG